MNGKRPTDRSSERRTRMLVPDPSADARRDRGDRWPRVWCCDGCGRDTRDGPLCRQCLIPDGDE